MSNFNRDKYLSYDEVANLTGYKIGTLRNFVSGKGNNFKLNIYYVKPHGGTELRSNGRKEVNDD